MRFAGVSLLAELLDLDPADRDAASAFVARVRRCWDDFAALAAAGAVARIESDRGYAHGDALPDVAFGRGMAEALRAAFGGG